MERLTRLLAVAYLIVLGIAQPARAQGWVMSDVSRMQPWIDESTVRSYEDANGDVWVTGKGWAIHDTQYVRRGVPRVQAFVNDLINNRGPVKASFRPDICPVFISWGWLCGAARSLMTSPRDWFGHAPTSSTWLGVEIEPIKVTHWPRGSWQYLRLWMTEEFPSAPGVEPMSTPSNAVWFPR